MIRAILIDDEYLAVQLMQNHLSEFVQVEVLAFFTDITKALDYLENNHVDVVFLDIEMPETDGLEASQQILDIDTQIQIVFVTAYSKYAVEAFELNAIDYLLKPVLRERLEKTLKKIEGRQPELENRVKKSKYNILQKTKIISFGEFNLYKNSQNEEKISFRTSKSKELLALLNEHIDLQVHKEKVIESLYPYEPLEKANACLYTSTYYLKKVFANISCKPVFEYKNSYFILKSEHLFSDSLEFRKLYKNRAHTDEKYLEDYQSLIGLYTGKYLYGHDYLWAVDYERWYEDCFLEAATALSEYYYKKKHYDMSIYYGKKAIEVDYYNEMAYSYLIKSYLGKNDKPHALQIFLELREILRKELGIKPSKELIDLIEN